MQAVAADPQTLVEDFEYERSLSNGYLISSKPDVLTVPVLVSSVMYPRPMFYTRTQRVMLIIPYATFAYPGAQLGSSLY